MNNQIKPTGNQLSNKYLGFVDSASVHSAISTLLTGRKREWTSWEQQSLLEVTYLLMSGNIRLSPGPSPYFGPSGPIRHVIKRFPSLEATSRELDGRVEAKTRTWAARNPAQLKKALDDILREPVSVAWADVQIEHFWVNHVEMYGSLFNQDFIPQIARTLNCSSNELERVHSLSSNLAEVRLWQKGKGDKEVAELAKLSWLIACLIRGRYHEHLAEARGLHLVAHPFRKGIERDLGAGYREKVTSSAQYFIKMIIGSALLERNCERRIEQWVDNIDTARRAITLGTVQLGPAVLASDAERIAADAAKTIQLPCAARFIPRLLDYTVSVGLGSLVAITLSPWLALLPAGAQQAYRLLRRRSVGDDLTKMALSTKAQFSALAGAVPGRIEREMVAPKDKE
jgi:hypothetical protein